MTQAGRMRAHNLARQWSQTRYLNWIIQQAGKLLIWSGLIIALIGAIVLLGSHFRCFKPGRLPGDVFVQRNGFTLFIPITTMVLLSLLLTGIFYLVNLFRR